MNDRQNQSNNTHTIPVTNSVVITLGGNRTMANDRGDVTKEPYSKRIAKIKTRICGCGDKLRGNEVQCGKCKNERFLNKL